MRRRTIAFIPARSGSQRVRLKNLRMVGGLSLAGRTAIAALDACPLAVLSTDAVAVRDTVRTEVGERRVTHAPLADHERPAELAGPHAQIEDAIADWMRMLDVLNGQVNHLDPSDVIVLLQPTSPFRRVETIRECIRLVRDEGYDSALTVTLAFRRNGRVRGHDAPEPPYPLRVLWNAPDPLWRPRSQDAQPEGYENGAVYAFTVEHFRRTRCRMGGREACVPISQWEAFEIDTPEDLEVARLIAPMFDSPAPSNDTALEGGATRRPPQ